MKQIITALSMVPLLLIGCDDEPTEALEEPMLPYAEAIAEETMEAAESPPETEGEPGARIAIPSQVKAAVSVTPFTPEIECPGTMVTFDEDSARLDDDAREALDSFAACVNETHEAEALTVRNEVDAAPVEDFNEALAAQRAIAVVTYLTEQDVAETNFGVVAVGLEGSSDMPRLFPNPGLAK